MINEEERRIEEKRLEIINLQKNVGKLIRDLQMDSPDPIELKSNTLIQQIEELKSIELELKGKELEKMKEWIQFKEIEKEFMIKIGQPVDHENYNKVDGIPGENEVKNFNLQLTLTFRLNSSYGNVSFSFI